MTDLGHIYDRVVETAILIVLLVEYFWGRSDTDLKNEAKRKKKAKEKDSVDMTGMGRPNDVY